MKRKPILDNGGAKNLFNQLWTLWIEPEIIERMKREKKETYTIPGAIAIIIPPKGKKQVLFGPEAKIKAKVRLVEGKTVKKGDPLYEDDIIKYEEILKPETVGKNNGYFILIGEKNYWHILFDLKLWNGEMEEKYSRVEEFIQTSTTALTQRNYSAFIDNLFSASELIIDTSLLLYLPYNNRSKKHSCKVDWYKEMLKAKEMTESPFLKNHNKLQQLRPSARYANEPLKPDADKYKNMLEIVKEEFVNLEKPVKDRVTFQGKL